MGIGVSKCWRINSLARAVSRASTAVGLVLMHYPPAFPPKAPFAAAR